MKPLHTGAFALLLILAISCTPRAAEPANPVQTEPLATVCGNEGRHCDENAAERFFDPTSHPGRIDHLLSDRLEVRPGEQSAGPDVLGNALDAAATGDRDEPSARIVAETIHRLASDTNTDLPASLRDSAGHMLSMWIDDVNVAVTGRVGPDPDDPLTLDASGGFLGDQAHAYFHPAEIFEVMLEAAKDPSAYQEMWDHQRAYAAARLEYEAARDKTPIDGIAKVVENAGEVFSVLAEAKGNAFAEIAKVHGAPRTAEAAWIGALVNSVVGAAAARHTRGEVTAEGGWHIHAIVENSEIDSMPMAQDDVAELYGNTNANLKDLVKYAMYRHEIGHPIPADSPLRSDGRLIPPHLMISDQVAEFVTGQVAGMAWDAVRLFRAARGCRRRVR